MGVVFLDANLLFSAAYRDDAGLLRLWRIADTLPVKDQPDSTGGRQRRGYSSSHG